MPSPLVDDPRQVVTPRPMPPEVHTITTNDLQPLGGDASGSDEDCTRDAPHATALLPLAQRHSRQSESSYEYSSSSGGCGSGRSKSKAGHLPVGSSQSVQKRFPHRLWSRCRRTVAGITYYTRTNFILVMMGLWIIYLQWQLLGVFRRVQPIGDEQHAYSRSRMRLLPRPLHSEAGRQALAMQRQFPYANLEGSGPVTIRSPVSATHNDSGVPLFAAATLISPASPNEDHNPCHMTYLLYRSLRRVDPEHTVDFLIFYVEDDEVAMRKMRATDHYCQLLDQQEIADQSPICVDAGVPSRPTSANVAIFDGIASPHSRFSSARRCFPRGSVRWLAIPNVERFLRAHPQVSPRRANWAYSLNKLSIFSRTEYSRILVLDSDMLVVSPLHSLFHLDADLAGGQDTWTCLHSQINGGMFVFQPSDWLLEAVNSLATAQEQPACISGELMESDQEVLNCLCGWGGAGFSRRPEVKCQLLPWFAHVMPGYRDCEDYHAHDVMVIHYAGGMKPWRRLPPECMTRQVAEVATEDQPDEWFKADQRARCFTGRNALFTYYFCVKQHEERLAREWRVNPNAVRPAAMPHHNCRLFES